MSDVVGWKTNSNAQYEFSWWNCRWLTLGSGSSVCNHKSCSYNQATPRGKKTSAVLLVLLLSLSLSLCSFFLSLFLSFILPFFLSFALYGLCHYNCLSTLKEALAIHHLPNSPRALCQLHHMFCQRPRSLAGHWSCWSHLGIVIVLM